MRLERAVEILQRLRDGEDPRTGRPLPAGSPAQDPDVVRALYTVLEGVPEEPAEREAARPRAPHPGASRAGRPWSAEEDERLGIAFDAGEPISRLARAFERSVKAIRLRLVKLGRLSPEEAPAPRRREPAVAAV